MSFFLIISVGSILVIFINIVPLLFIRAPLLNSNSIDKYDVIVVLGNPAHTDGSIGDIAQQRVQKSVELFNEGQAKYILFTGSAVYNRYAEADVMADFAHSLGVPRTALMRETKARNTYQNLLYATEIMQQNHWRSAAIVTSPYHVKRTAFMVSDYEIIYRVVPCEVPISGWIWQSIVGQWENYLLTRIAIFGYSTSSGFPRQVQALPGDGRK